MINPLPAHIGRYVVYMDTKPPVHVVEAGRITSFNNHTVFVAFPKKGIAETTSQGCSREDLYWLHDFIALPRLLAASKRALEFIRNWRVPQETQDAALQIWQARQVIDTLVDAVAQLEGDEYDR